MVYPNNHKEWVFECLSLTTKDGHGTFSNHSVQ